ACKTAAPRACAAASRNGGSRPQPNLGPRWRFWRRRRTAMLARFFAFFCLVCTLVRTAQPLIPQEQVTVFAVASLKNTLDDINAVFTKATGIKVVTSYEASSALAKQIEQGAPADVFISADLRWMDYVAERKLINPDTRINLLGNKLV